MFRASLIAITAALAAPALARTEFSWRYYRPGNTGIQGDFCDALWIGPDNDPWIGGYDPGFEEGGLAKFVQAEDRWINISNIDYPEIGHPENTGTTRVRDITQDAQGNLWMGTGRGVLVFNPALGPASLKRYDATNSPWPGGWVTNIEIAPDGSIWASGYSTVWGGGGMMRFNPATQAWTFLGHSRPERLAIQPKPAGGYYVWASDPPGSIGLTQRFDSATQTWTTMGSTPGSPRNLPGNKSVDSAGNMWVHRVLADGFHAVLDCRRPDGSWIGVPALPGGGGGALTAFAPLQTLADSDGQVWKFDGVAWQPLGDWGNTNWTYDLAIDSIGTVWASGVGGASRRDPATGTWQRYRVTNTSQYDSFNADLALGTDQTVYACANAGPGAGGMVRFDGTRWTGFNNVHYGRGIDWPFPTDNSQALLVRSSDNSVVVNPTFNFTSVWNGATWSPLPGGSDDVVGYAQDSTGRTWSLGKYMDLGYFHAGGYTNVGILSWGQRLRVDPSRTGTVWAQAGYEIVRTDGAYRFSRTIDDFPQLTSQSDTFGGLAVAPDGSAWVGASVMFGAGGSGGALLHINPNSGAYTISRYDLGWNFPGFFVYPLAVAPDGKVWMAYDTDFLTARRGLCWYDPATGQVGDFPAPPGGEPQWGGLPHAAIDAMEVRIIPNGYELWMTCISRGIAVLSVTQPCRPDLTTGAIPGQAGYGMPNGTLNNDDFFYYLSQYAAGNLAVCDLTTGAIPGAPGYGTPNGVLNNDDFFFYLSLYAAGC